MRQGYKQSDVGIIPEDWAVVPLSRTAKRITRGASPRPIDSPVWFDSRSSVGWVRISDVTRSGRYLTETTQRLSEAGIRRSRPVPAGSLIMSICATVGRPVETLIDACIHDGFVVFDQPVVDQAFLYHLLAALEPTWSKRGQTGSQMNLNTGLINACLVPIPQTEAEQKAIAAALSDMDALLAGLDRLIAKKRCLKQASMQQLLTGQTRLSGFQGDWETEPLASVVADLEAGVSVNSIASANHAATGELGVLKTSCIADGTFDPTEFKVIDSRDLDRAKLNPRRNTLIISRMNTPNLVGEVGFVEHDYPNLFLPDRLWMTRFRPESGICPRWLAYVLSSTATKQAIKDLASGTSGSMKNIAKAKLLALPLAFPSAREQEAIATILSDMDSELFSLEARRNKTRALKQGMLQELLTGKTRLV